MVILKMVVKEPPPLNNLNGRLMQNRTSKKIYFLHLSKTFKRGIVLRGDLWNHFII